MYVTVALARELWSSDAVCKCVRRRSRALESRTHTHTHMQAFCAEFRLNQGHGTEDTKSPLNKHTHILSLMHMYTHSQIETLTLKTFESRTAKGEGNYMMQMCNVNFAYQNDSLLSVSCM